MSPRKSIAPSAASSGTASAKQEVSSCNVKNGRDQVNSIMLKSHSASMEKGAEKNEKRGSGGTQSAIKETGL